MNNTTIRTIHLLGQFNVGQAISLLRKNIDCTPSSFVRELSSRCNIKLQAGLARDRLKCPNIEPNHSRYNNSIEPSRSVRSLVQFNTQVGDKVILLKINPLARDINLFNSSRNQPIPLHQIRQMSSTGPSDEEKALRKKFKPKEVTFKTPYGQIAGLEWGSAEAPHKILCAHGWLDNAGSFERLVPFILNHNDNSEKYHIVAMDMPGVGHSSHKPPGSDYTTFSHIVEMRRVAQQLNWDRLTLLAHSQGSHFSFIYACIYPNQVETLISIDLAHPLTRQVHNWQVTVANSIEEHFKCEYHHEDDPTTNIRVPVYSEVDALKRLMDGHSASLTRESAEVLLKRGARKQRWGYTFNRDVRLRYLSLEMRPDDDLMLQFMEGPFKPNLFIIRANKSPYRRPEEARLKYYDLFKKNCLMFRDIILNGTHHLHMNNPEMVAPEINNFLDEVLKVKSTAPNGEVSVRKSSL